MFTRRRKSQLTSWPRPSLVKTPCPSAGTSRVRPRWLTTPRRWTQMKPLLAHYRRRSGSERGGERNTKANRGGRSRRRRQELARPSCVTSVQMRKSAASGVLDRINFSSRFVFFFILFSLVPFFSRSLSTLPMMKDNVAQHREHSPASALEWDSYPFSDGDWTPCNL